MIEVRPPVQDVLIKTSAGRGEQHPVGVLEGIQRLGEGLRHHYHARTSPEGGVVHRPVRTLGVVAEIDQFHFHQPGIEGPAEYPHTQRLGKVVGEDGDYRDLHCPKH